jgi:hypothetical protein
MTLTIERKKKAWRHPEELALIHWGFEKRILMPCIKKDRCIMSEGKIDYVLWYGALAELETKFIVVRAERLSLDHYWDLLQSMGKYSEDLTICMDVDLNLPCSQDPLGPQICEKKVRYSRPSYGW